MSAHFILSHDAVFFFNARNLPNVEWEGGRRRKVSFVFFFSHSNGAIFPLDAFWIRLNRMKGKKKRMQKLRCWMHSVSDILHEGIYEWMIDISEWFVRFGDLTLLLNHTNSLKLNELKFVFMKLLCDDWHR